mmetsp:Transcript_4156/g.9936  ORF Transcript_4156/g.9936 Transcript_4156/m.9936 type:complete len:241 (+) Transcript_4156:278-1000(+)
MWWELSRSTHSKTISKTVCACFESTRSGSPKSSHSPARRSGFLFNARRSSVLLTLPSPLKSTFAKSCWRASLCLWKRAALSARRLARSSRRRCPDADAVSRLSSARRLTNSINSGKSIRPFLSRSMASNTFSNRFNRAASLIRSSRLSSASDFRTSAGSGGSSTPHASITSSRSLTSPRSFMAISSLVMVPSLDTSSRPKMWRRSKKVKSSWESMLSLLSVLMRRKTVLKGASNGSPTAS